MLEEEVLGAYGENAFTIMGIITRPLRRAGGDSEAFMAEAMAGDYEQLNEVCRSWARKLDNGEDC